MAVKFLKRHQAYNAGEIAGFSPDKEAQLCREGFARPYVKGDTAQARPDTNRNSQDDPDFDPDAGKEDKVDNQNKQQTPPKTTQATTKGAGNGKGKSTR